MTDFLFCRQYKDVVGEEERYNLKDVIHKKNEFSDLEEIDILQVGRHLLLQYTSQFCFVNKRLGSVT